MRPPIVCVEKVWSYLIPHLRPANPDSHLLQYFLHHRISSLHMAQYPDRRKRGLLFGSWPSTNSDSTPGSHPTAKSQGSLELKEQNLRSIRKVLEKYSDTSKPATPAEVRARTENPKEVKSRLERRIEDLEEDIECLRATQKYEAALAEAEVKA